MLQSLRTFTLYAPDLEAATVYYTNVIGHAPYFAVPYYVGWDLNGSELGLVPDVPNVAIGNNTTTYWKVDSVADAITHMLNHGASLHEPITQVGEGMYVASVRDPWGNVLGVIEEQKS